MVDQAQEMGSRRALRWYDYITVNINWFALTTRSQVLTALLLPLLVQRFIGEASKGEAVGTLRLWGLMVALLIQALMGIFSDRLRSRWGRRRPFIFFGVLVEVLVFLLIGFSTDLQGTTGYWVLFTLNILSMVGSNASQAATQGLIPDLVPDANKGRFSGIKAALELPIPLIFVSFVAGPMVAKGNLWGALLALIVVLVVCMLLSMLVPERAISRAPTPINWQPVLRLLAMTAVFTGIILGMREVVKWVIQGAVGMGANAACSWSAALDCSRWASRFRWGSGSAYGSALEIKLTGTHPSPGGPSTAWLSWSGPTTWPVLCSSSCKRSSMIFPAMPPRGLPRASSCSWAYSSC